jgi:hypothetical protein
VDLLADEGGETGNVIDVEAEGLASERLEHVVERGLFDEAHVDCLDVGEVGHELELDSHAAGEAHVLEEDREGFADGALADPDGQDD